MEDECWDSGIEIHEECPYRKDITIKMTPTQLKILKELSRKYEDVEFSVYFNFEEEKPYTNVFKITEFIIPEQEVTRSSVKYNDNVHTRGVIHKHPNNSKAFSSTDEEYINANHDISLLWCNNDIVQGTGRYKTPCGCIMRCNVNAEIDYECDEEEVKRMISISDEKIKEHVFDTFTFKRNWLESVKCPASIMPPNLPKKSTCPVCMTTRKTRKMVKCGICGEMVCPQCASHGENIEFMCKNCFNPGKLINYEEYRYM